MSERKWTEAQTEAFSSSAHDILVSAAAGSGKTAVLTKRILDKLTDPEHPLDISRLLIVTFTKAAAGELKERIRGAFITAMAEHPDNKRLQKQYVRLSAAKITTIHGFCLDVIRQNSELLKMPSRVKVSDETQTRLLMEQVADRVIDNYYASLPGYDDIDSFIEFADNFISIQDDSLTKTLVSLYQKVSSLPEGVEFFRLSSEQLKAAAQGSVDQTAWGKLVLSHYEKVFSYYSAVFSQACNRFANDDSFAVKYYPAFLSDKEFSDACLTACQASDFMRLAHLITHRSAQKLLSVKAELQDEDTLYFKEIRSEFSDAVKKAAGDFFSFSDEELTQTAAKSADFVEKLYRFLLTFERRYTHEKRIRSLLDFADLERLTASLLTDKEGKPTETARRISEAFDEIYIDEYQDVNELQDRIFAAIAKGSDRFMVGDIKQSIYGFRGAEPSLFAAYRKNQTVKTIFLSHNFRCDLPIIDFVNRVCGRLFTECGTTVPYEKGDALVCGKVDSEAAPVEIHLLTGSEKKTAVCRAEEAKLVAQRIQGLLSEGYSPKDICILLRSASKSAHYYEAALTECGIPCRNRISVNLFTNPEVLLVLNLLHVINNPYRDVYLAGTLKSPIFNYSLSDLITVRNEQRNGSLYEAIVRHEEQTPTPKGQAFLSWLSSFRSMVNEPISRVLWRIYTDLQLFAHCATDATKEVAALRKENLILLYDLARQFENGSYKSLYSFICHIRDLIESEVEVPSASHDEKENAVKILTIHQSKGLEFPVVFLSDTASSFHEGDRHERVILDKDYGVTLKLSDDTGLASIDTFYRRASGLGVIAKSLDEEIRILYVALTRAIHRLIITGVDPDPAARVRLCHRYQDDRSKAVRDIYRQRNNYLDWILLTKEASDKVIVHPSLHVQEDESRENANDVANKEVNAAYDMTQYAQAVSEFSERFAYRYPQEINAALPAKLAVSDLYPAILDDYDDALKLSELRKSNMRHPRLSKDTAISATEKGTATHQFMQFCSFDRLRNGDVTAEIQVLTERGFLDSQTAALVDKAMISRLLASPLFSELCEAKDCRRELRFNTHFPAAGFTKEEETQAALADSMILVQGIMDCVFTDRNGLLTLLDYKTDRITKSLPSQEADRLLIERHARQLSYYRVACERMMCRPVERVLLYAFDLGRAIEVPLSDLITF